MTAIAPQQSKELRETLIKSGLTFGTVLVTIFAVLHHQLVTKEDKMKASDIFYNPTAYAALRAAMSELANAHDVATVVMHELHKDDEAAKKNSGFKSFEELRSALENMVAPLVTETRTSTPKDAKSPEAPVTTEEPRTGEGTVKWEAGDHPGTYIKQVNENSLELAIALPGIRREDVSVEIHESNDKFFVLAIEATGEVVGKITKGIRIPARYDAENIAARVENGLLFLGLNVKAKARARTVPVM